MTTLLKLPFDVMYAACISAHKSYEEVNDTDADWKKIYADYSQFRRDQNQWFRLTETTFDRYMQQADL